MDANTILTVEELAAHLRVSETTIRSWMRREQNPMPRMKAPGQSASIRIIWGDVESWLKNGG